jgi:hypothetical protein
VGEGITERLARIFREYIENYQRGSERFGFWWKLFNASMLTLASSSSPLLLFKH